jgi:uncharacterized protein (TIGR02611 family)
MHKLRQHTKKVLIGIIGGIVVLIGIVAIPYPGPGWLIVFAGLTILATEFAWAQRALDYLRKQYDNWVAWLNDQHLSIRLLVLTFTGVVVAATLWLLGGYGLLNDWLHLGWDWLRSPLLR